MLFSTKMLMLQPPSVTQRHLQHVHLSAPIDPEENLLTGEGEYYLSSIYTILSFSIKYMLVIIWRLPKLRVPQIIPQLIGRSWIFH